MCECENAQCPHHAGRGCDTPSTAKVRWHGFLTTLCQHCLDMAVQTGAGNLEIIKPITAATQTSLFPEVPAYGVHKDYDDRGKWTGDWIVHNPGGGHLSGAYHTPEEARAACLRRFPGVQVTMPKMARLLKKGAVTGNETFDRVWGDFHGKMAEPENEDREFHEVLGEHSGKHQLLVALGKLNYMMSAGGFDEWIAEGYAATTGDMLIKKLPAHTHVYPLLSKLRDMLKEILEAYASFGVDTFADLERLLDLGPNRDTLWDWFKSKKKGMFRFRGRVTEPYDLEYISGKWGHIRIDDETLTQELADKYEAELVETEEEMAALPTDSAKGGKTVEAKRADLLEMQAELDSALEAIHYRVGLQGAWREFKAGGWASPADDVLDALNVRYRETFTLGSLVTEASEWFNATPDEVYPIEQAGEEEAQDAEEKGIVQEPK